MIGFANLYLGTTFLFNNSRRLEYSFIQRAIGGDCSKERVTMEEWKRLLQDSVITAEKLSELVNCDSSVVRRVAESYPLMVNPYYLSLIEEEGDPIWRQAIPSEEELTMTGYDDPLSEEHDSPVSTVVHRYPDRALLYVFSTCSMICRFCTRKRKVGKDLKKISMSEIMKGVAYIKEHEEIRDVVISGGDPLMHNDETLDTILSALREIPHLEIIRIGSRMPVVLPQRITDSLCEVLSKHHPLYINTHFNHPREITNESKEACAKLANVGIPLGNQSVLLKGVNDDPEVMRELVHKLLLLRVKPYYIYQADLVKGTDHFRTSVQEGLEIIRSLRGHTSGMAVPHYVIDAPGGGGKIALMPEATISHTDEEIRIQNYEGEIFTYPSHPTNVLCESLETVNQ